MRDRPAQPARTHGYARVSSRDQGEHGTSLEEQQDSLLGTAVRWEWPAPAVRVEIESGSEGRLEKRDELHRLLAEVRPGDAILVTRVDRWSRDISWGVKSVRDLVKRGIGWHSIGDGIDASTEQGDIALGYLALAADHEHKRIKRRTVGARLRLLEQGRWAHAAVPFGYQRGPRAEKRQLELLPIAEDAQLVVLASELCVGGKSLDEVQEELQVARPDRGWSRTVLRKMLRSRVYIGQVLVPGHGWVKGKHPPIVDVGLWARVQAALTSRNKGGRRPSEGSRTAGWLVRGELAWCWHCGARMRSVYSKLTDYLGCSAKCGASYVRVDANDEAVAALAIAQLRSLRSELAAPPPEKPPRTRDFGAERARCETKRARAVALAVDGTISKAELVVQRERLDDELAKIEAAAAEEAQRYGAVQDPVARRAALADLKKLEAAWKRAPVDEKRAVLKKLARKVAVRAGEAPEVAWIPVEELVRTPSNNP